MKPRVTLERIEPDERPLRWWVALICAVGLAVLAWSLQGCARPRVAAARTVKAIGQMAAEARTFVRAKCGSGGRIVDAECKARSDTKCPKLYQCRDTMRALHSLQIGVLGAKLTIRTADSDEKIRVALSSVMKLARPVGAALRHWGLTLGGVK